MPCLLVNCIIIIVLIFFIQSKKSRRRTASEKGKNVQYDKKQNFFTLSHKFKSDLYQCKCFIHHTIIILFLLSEFLAIAFASTAWRRSSRAGTRCERAKQTTGKYTIPKKYHKRQFHDVKAQRVPFRELKESEGATNSISSAQLIACIYPQSQCPPLLSRNNGERRAAAYSMFIFFAFQAKEIILQSGW